MSTDRKLRVVNGGALSEAIAELADQVPSGAAFALIAALWKSLPAEAVDGIVHMAAAKVGAVERREVFAAYQWIPANQPTEGSPS